MQRKFLSVLAVALVVVLVVSYVGYVVISGNAIAQIKPKPSGSPSSGSYTKIKWDDANLVFITYDTNYMKKVYITSSDVPNKRTLILSTQKGKYSNVQWSPKGDKIAYIESNQGVQSLKTINKHGSKQTLYSISPFMHDIYHISHYLEWSNDGTYIIIREFDWRDLLDHYGESSCNLYTRLLKVSLDGTVETLRSAEYVVSPCDEDHAEAVRSTGATYYPIAISPSGKLLAKTIDFLNNTQKIVIMNARDGSDEQVLTNADPDMDQADWFCDGSFYVYFEEDSLYRGSINSVSTVIQPGLDSGAEPVISDKQPVMDVLIAHNGYLYDLASGSYYDLDGDGEPDQVIKEAGIMDFKVLRWPC